MTLPEIDHVIYVVAHAYTFFTSEQYSFGLPLLITCVLTICQVKLTQSTGLEQKHLDHQLLLLPLVVTSIGIKPINNR